MTNYMTLNAFNNGFFGTDLLLSFFNPSNWIQKGRIQQLVKLRIGSLM